MTASLLPRELGNGIVLYAAAPKFANESFAVVDAERDRLREWLPWVDHTTSVKHTKQYLEAVERVDAAGEGLHTVIQVDGRFAGHADMRIVPIQRSGEVGYWLAGWAVGRGVVTRVVAELFDLGFESYELHRIQLQAATGNTRSRAVAERLGMRYEGIRREAEQLPKGFVDLAVYSTLAHEWSGATAVLSRPPAQPAGPR